jgi:hypothetical protein
MPRAEKPQVSCGPQSRLYMEIEEKILLRVVLPLQKSGMTSREMASALKVGVKRLTQIIQQAEEREARKLRNRTTNVRERIRQAVADLLEKGALPETLTARRQAIADYGGISSRALSTHIDLWHLGYLDQPESAVDLLELEDVVDMREVWNQHQSQAARDRIQQAVADLRERGDWPDKTTARFNQLVKYRIGGSTLYKHRDLWDPEYVQAATGLQVAQ